VLLHGEGGPTALDGFLAETLGTGGIHVGVTVAGHPMGVGEDALVMAVLSVVLVWAASRAFKAS
jgi:hypothetical protein